MLFPLSFLGATPCLCHMMPRFRRRHAAFRYVTSPLRYDIFTRCDIHALLSVYSAERDSRVVYSRPPRCRMIWLHCRRLPRHVPVLFPEMPPPCPPRLFRRYLRLLTPSAHTTATVMKKWHANKYDIQPSQSAYTTALRRRVANRAGCLH